jgi:hypothetical protein
MGGKEELHRESEKQHRLRPVKGKGKVMKKPKKTEYTGITRRDTLRFSPDIS